MYETQVFPPLRGWFYFYFRCLPTACAVGCTLSPLRGFHIFAGSKPNCGDGYHLAALLIVDSPHQPPKPLPKNSLLRFASFICYKQFTESRGVASRSFL